MNACPFVAFLAALSLPLFAATDPVDPMAVATDLEELGVVSAGLAEAGQPDRFFADASVSQHDEDSGASVNPDLKFRDRRACFMHSPYRKTHGAVFQEFTFRLPSSPAAAIEGFTAMQEDSDRSDGVTFRVLVEGETAWAEHRKSKEWQPFRADLARWAGRTVNVRFEQSPGPKNNTGWDGAFWGGRRLLLPGFKAAARPNPPALDLSRLSARENESWVPLSGFKGRVDLAVTGDVVQLSYRGEDGELNYVWDTAAIDARHPIGLFRLHATMSGDRACTVPLGQGAQLDWTQAVSLAGRDLERSRRAVTCVHRYTNAAGERATLTLAARIEEKSLVLEARCDRPWLARYSPGLWGPVAVRRSLPMPYYGHPIDFLPAANLFVSTFPDWTASGAARFQKQTALYDPLTDGTRHPLRERHVFTAAWHVNEAFANIPNPRSPWRADMGRRIVLDIWNGKSFDDTLAGLTNVAAFGVRDDFIIMHTWQRDGYDNGLPAHWPPNAKQGGEEAMQRLSAAAKSLGHRLSLHENYVDYYPNYEHFTTNDIALNSKGELQKAWFNEGTGIQSFAIKPAVINRLSREQSPEIHQRYGTTAAYLDVHSCVPLWFHVDQQAGIPGAGLLQTVWDAHRELWRYGRRTHGGPMTGEGNGHWPWSGWLDGVEAQFGTGWPWAEGLGAPLLVDFNLLRIHPLQLNHGQGYYDRWFGKTPPWGNGIPMCVLDEYRMQEIAFGHAGFLSYAEWRRPGIAWLEHHLTTPVTARHATESVRDIRYFLDGQWVDASTAARVDPGEQRAAPFHRVRIDYANGLTIVANAAAADLPVDGYVLPPFGWLARMGTDFAAGTVRRDGVVVDFVDAPELQLANARRVRDWEAGSPRPVRPSVREFQSLENRRVRFSYDWKTATAITDDWRCFVHICRPDASSYDGWKIVAQQDHNLRPPTSAWTNEGRYVDGPYDFRLPDAMEDGRYTWFIGLWRGEGERMNMDGPNGGHGRIRLGEIVVADGGKNIRFEPAAEDARSRADWFRANLNTAEKTIDFGFVKTDGGVVRKREGRSWQQWTYPAEGVHVEWAGGR